MGSNCGEEGGGSLDSQDLSMIGKSRRFNFFCMLFKEGELSLIKKMCYL